jgi:lipoyl(octanoyl) transferase
MRPAVHVRQLGRCAYADSWQRMREFTAQRDSHTPDEFWVLEHEPVFTLGQAGRREHLLYPGEIPIIACDRGGQVTYHGPGQLVVYVLFDLRRAGLGVRALVRKLEQAVIDCLGELGLAGQRRAGAPGVYVDEAKIAALGLRVRHGCSYHGLALNVAMDLAPFARINPCGYPGLAVTQVCDHGCALPVAAVAKRLMGHLYAQLAHETTPAESAR